jgi:hypothetical protein
MRHHLPVFRQQQAQCNMKASKHFLAVHGFQNADTYIVAGKWFDLTKRQGNTTVVTGSSRITEFELLVLALSCT